MHIKSCAFVNLTAQIKSIKDNKMVFDQDWLLLFGWALVAFAGFGLYELRSIRKLLEKNNNRETSN